MKKLSTMLFIVVFIFPLILLANGDEEDHEHIAPVNNASYQKECSDCHFAYQPGLLPARSWQKLMTTLDEHFEDNAELDETVQKTLTDYLIKNAADSSKEALSKRLIRRLTQSDVPLRITELSYFKHEHDEMPQKMVTGNPEVKSLSYCDKCHTRAETGSYEEDEIKIPGYGRWDD